VFYLKILIAANPREKSIRISKNITLREYEIS